jgi:hypothetical protein
MEFQFIRESISKGEHRRWRAERDERSDVKSHYNMYLCINMSVSQCSPKKNGISKKESSSPETPSLSTLFASCL